MIKSISRQRKIKQEVPFNLSLGENDFLTKIGVAA